MKVLVTGANGMLGRAVVSGFLRRGHDVRALVRPLSAVPRDWDEGRVEVLRTDLRAATPALAEAFEGVDVLVHLAAAVTGNEDLQFASTVVGTERLLDAMALSQTKTLVLASSFSVYDWSEIKGRLTEDSPVESDIYTRDGYAVAKIWQERLVRRMSAEHGWAVTVLRPGFIWAPGNAFVAGLGQKVGPAHVVIGPLNRLPLTHVVNCADAFVTATEAGERAAGHTFNVVDGHGLTSWRYVGLYLRGTGSKGLRVPVPYALGRSAVLLVNAASKIIFKGKGKLPSLFVPDRFEARFKAPRCDNRKLRNVLGWSPPLGLAECLGVTYGDRTALEGRAAIEDGAPEPGNV